MTRINGWNRDLPTFHVCVIFCVFGCWNTCFTLFPAEISSLQEHVKLNSESLCLRFKFQIYTRTWLPQHCRLHTACVLPRYTETNLCLNALISPTSAVPRLCLDSRLFLQDAVINCSNQYLAQRSLSRCVSVFWILSCVPFKAIVSSQLIIDRSAIRSGSALMFVSRLRNQASLTFRELWSRRETSARLILDIYFSLRWNFRVILSISVTE